LSKQNIESVLTGRGEAADVKDMEGTFLLEMVHKPEVGILVENDKNQGLLLMPRGTAGRAIRHRKDVS